MHKSSILFVIVSMSSAGALLTNGDFEDSLHIGWSLYINYPLAGYDTLDRGTSFYPDPDYEVKFRKFDNYYARLYQTVEIPSTDLEFSADAEIRALEYDSIGGTSWAVAAIRLTYLDEVDNILGETRICHMSPHCPWVNSSTVHLIEVTYPDSFYTHTLYINDELANLPGVNPLEIVKIKVELYDTTNGC